MTLDDLTEVEHVLPDAETSVAAPGSSDRIAILVAGMHRTGTSAITRVLSLLGLELPRHLVPGVRDNNDLGFWESAPISQAHDGFLASIGSAWDDVSPIARSVFASARADQFAVELRQALRSEYGNSSLFVVKDPRLCRLIPVWVAALEGFGARPSFVITTRNPLEVAGSLKARDGFTPTKSCLLWLRHVLDAERDSRGFPRVFVSYERLLRDWVTTTDRIARELQLFWPRADHETHVEIEAYLSSALRHHSFDYSDLRARSDVVEWVKQAFETVSRAATDTGGLDSELLDEIRGQLDRADQAYGPLLAQQRAKIAQVDSARAQAESELGAAAGQLAERQAELDSLNADNQRVTARLVEEIETVARLQRVVEGLAATLAKFGESFGTASATLIASDGTPVALRATLEVLLHELRQRAAVEEEPEIVRHAVDDVIGHTDEFLALLDDDRAGLLAAVAARDADLAEALRRLEIAQAETAAQSETLRAVADERDELLARRSAEYEGLRSDAQRLASAVADAETRLAKRESALSEASIRVDAAEARLQAVTEELETAVSERDSKLTETERLLETVRFESEAAAAELRGSLRESDTALKHREAELEQALAERAAGLAEAERLLEKTAAESETAAADLRRALSETETTLSRREAELELARAERDAGLAENERLQLRLTEQGEELGHKFTEHEKRLDRTLEEARKLAAAVAEAEEALSRRDATLREQDEQLRVARSEVSARDELLARHAKQIDDLSVELRSRDEALATQSKLLADLETIGLARGRRWRSVTQFCSWLFPPTFERLGYIKAYLHLRRSDLFDADYYLSRYHDVSHSGLNPLMHYVEHGRREGRQPVDSPQEPASVATTQPSAPTPTSVLPTAPVPVEDDFAETLRRALAEQVPETAMIAVATAGEDHALSLAGYRTCPFPRASDDSYGGGEASGETALIANLEATRAAGAEFLFVPADRRALLDRNPRFRMHLHTRYSRVLDSEELGLCLAIHTPDSSKAWRRELADLAEWIERETNREVSILDWDTGLHLAEELPGCHVFAFSDPELPHIEGSVDVVAVETSSEERLAEARRVARQAVLEVPPNGSSPSLTASASLTEQVPSVSIVIPCHEQFAHTQACIRALGETLPTWFQGEILIIDDASGSATVADLQTLADSNPHVTLLRSEVNSGFLASVNHAASKAGGEFIVLLNNDTIPLPGWLPPLLLPFRTRDDVGAIGGRLVYPDGRLQEAGGLVFRDGSAAKFGYGDPDPDFPLFTVPREVDYCSGCLLAFRRDFFLESGGFDPAYGFGFYEDTDFCFRVRSLDHVVLYEPESVVVHVEGASAGTDLTQGAKRFQAVNASLFAERWRKALEQQHERPSELDRESLRQLTARAEKR